MTKSQILMQTSITLLKQDKRSVFAQKVIALSCSRKKNLRSHEGFEPSICFPTSVRTPVRGPNQVRYRGIRMIVY